MPSPIISDMLEQRAPRVSREQESDVDGHRWHSPAYVDEWVARYEAGGTPESRERQKRRLEGVFRSIPHDRRAPISVLDLGTGWGRLALALLVEFPAARVIALDFSRPMLDAARRNLAEHAGRVDFAEVDLETPGCITDLGLSFDVVVSTMALHHVSAPRLVALYREIGEALAPGGVFVCADSPRRGVRAWLRESARRVFPPAGGHGATQAGHRRMLADAGLDARCEPLGGETLIVAGPRTA